MRGLAIALLFGVFLTEPVLAAEGDDACLGSADEASCGEAWIAREEKQLNEAWRHLTEVADGDVAKALAAEQDAWRRFSDLACLFKKDPGFGGAGGPTGYHACRAKVIVDRTEALRGYTSYIDN
jgi:uncharacterized protein YecT (DUF1311 family)